MAELAAADNAGYVSTASGQKDIVGKSKGKGKPAPPLPAKGKGKTVIAKGEMESLHAACQFDDELALSALLQKHELVASDSLCLRRGLGLLA